VYEKKTMQPTTNEVAASTIDYGNADEIRKKLIAAIDAHESMRVVSRLYVKYVVARMRNRVHASQRLGVDRRTIQRWGKEDARQA
jgi:nucleoside diphosphate kinase